MIENILDILFNIFIYPIEFLMKNILNIIFNATDNYGLSIILLSITINIIILPLYYLAEKLKNDNQQILDKLQPRIDFFKKNFKKQELHFYLQTFYKINNYYPINNIKASLGLLLQIPFFIAAFHFIGNYEVFNQVSFGAISDLSKSDGLLFGLNILPFIMTIINLLSVYLYSKDMTKSERNQLLGMSFIFLVFLYFESSALLLYWSMNNLFSLIKNFIEHKFNLGNFKRNAISILTIPFYKIKQNKTLNFIAKDVYIQAIILFFGTIFIYKAIPMAASDTGMYLASYPMVAFSLVGVFLACVFVAYFVYYFMPKKIKYVITVLVVFGALVVLYYSFINPYELGVMTSLGVPDFNIGSASKNEILLFLALLYFLLILLFYFFSKVQKIILIIIFLSNIVLVVHTIFLGFNPKTINIMTSDGSKLFDTLNVDEDKLSKAYSFSKESNVIMMMMDTFQGNIFFDILKKYPKLKEQLTGFTYYKNTLSVGSDTSKSMPAILGGKPYIYIKKPNYSNAILEAVNMAKTYNYSYTKYPQDEICNLELPTTDTICVDTNEIKIEKEELKTIKEKIANSHNKLIGNFLNTSIIFIKTSFMLGVPHYLKSSVYIRIDAGSPPMDSYIYNLSQYHQLKNLSNLANVESNKKTFKVILNNLTHNIWMINDKCEVVDEKFSNYEGFFNSAYCSTKLLVDFFNKLKKLEIYDKTKIIIVSDHGAHNHKPIKSKFIPVTKSMASALMLVKDFDAKGNISISNKFLSNMDTYGISLSGVSNNVETKLDPIKNYQKDRQLIFVEEIDSKYNAKKVFKVKNNIFNKNNWKELSKKDILDMAQRY